MPKQITTWLGMVFIVAFSSCLDVVAIEMDMGKQLDVNRELASVGWSNVVSGLLGGYTGSYIFSQTIFTYRSGTNSRVVGVCVIAAEVAVVLLPLSVMSFLPRFFFAATLIFIAIDLMVEWLVKVYHKLLPREYFVLWLSFIAVNCVSLELGILLGISFAVLNFLLGYARARVVTHKACSSAAVRTYEARTVLAKKSDAIVYLELCGDLFFGSTVQILEDVQRAVLVRKTRHPCDSTNNNTFSQMAKRYLPALLERVGGHSGGRNCTQSNLPITHMSHADSSLECLGGTTPARNAQALPTQFVIMDFSRVSGLDASVVRSSFMILQHKCKRHGITVLFADVRPEIRTLLLGNEIVTDDTSSFYSTAASALEWCENQLLKATNHALLPDEKRLASSMSVLLHRFMGEPDDSSSFAGVDKFFKKLNVPVGHEFYNIADDPDHFYFVATGRVALFMGSDDGSSTSESASQDQESLAVVESVLPGAMFGEVDFFARQYRYMNAKAATEPCVVFETSRVSYDAMEKMEPELWKRLRDVLLQSMALAITNKTNVNTFNNTR